MCDEYEGQRPSAFYWLGVANGLGIKTSGLLTEEMYGLKEKEDEGIIRVRSGFRGN